MSLHAIQKKGGFHYAFLIVASGIAITCVPCALVLSCAGIYFTPVSEYLGVSKATFTMYFSLLNLAMMFMLFFGGKLLTRFDCRIVLSICVVLVGLSLIAMSFFNEVWQFYLSGITLGLGTAPLLYLAVPSLIDAWCKKKVGFFVGLCMAFTGIGGVIFNPIGTAFIQSGPEGWRMGYLVFGIVVLVVTLPFTLFIVRSDPADKGLAPYGAEEPDAVGAAASAAPAQGLPASKAMKTPAFFAIVIFCFLVTVNHTVYQFLPSYAQSFSGTFPEIAALTGVVASACMAGQAIGKVILGIVNDKSNKAGLVFGFGSGIVGIALMWTLPTQAVVLLVGSFLFGFVYACSTVQTPLLTRTVFTSRDYTTIYSRISMGGALGGVLAATFWGIIVDLPSGFSMMFTLSIVCMVLCFVLGIFALSQTKKLQAAAEADAQPAASTVEENVRPAVSTACSSTTSHS